MLSLQNSASMRHVADAHPDAAIRSMLSLRMIQISEGLAIELGDAVHFLIFEAGDALSAIKEALGFAPLENVVDGSRFGDADFTPSWEWIEVHEGWFELAYVFSDGGFGTIIFVQRADGADSDLIALCNEWSGITKAG